MERKNMWEHYTEEKERELEELAVRYRKCLDSSKTERMCDTVHRDGRGKWISEY